MLFSSSSLGRGVGNLKSAAHQFNPRRTLSWKKVRPIPEFERFGNPF